MNPQRIVIIGGGAAGFFAAVTCAELARKAEIFIFEKTSRFLSKVKISGGGRCNVTHSCFDARELTTRYPRGERALIAPFKQFQPRDTVAWFAARGVKLKTESDGRMFPMTDSSQTIIDCLLHAARQAGVNLKTNCGVESAARKSCCFELTLANGEKLECDKLLLATGGCRTAAMGQMAVSLGHSLEEPVPSLFSFHIEDPWLRELAGISVEDVEVSVPEMKLHERGPVLVTHWGLSGPAILRLSAWGARAMHERNYRFKLQIDWLPGFDEEKLAAKLQSFRTSHPGRAIVNVQPLPLPARLWEQLVLASGITPTVRWSSLSHSSRRQLIQKLLRTDFRVMGKSMNKDEFVTCGGVALRDVNFKTMESKICPGLFFAGEVLDIDGITGGFNFQAAWTTGWLAGKAMAQ